MSASSQSATNLHDTHDGPSDISVAAIDEKKIKQMMAPPRRSTFKSVCLVLTCTAAMVVNISNSTSVSIALPTIGQDLNIEEAKLQWLISAYSLSSGCLLLFFGRLADLYGRKKTFLLGSISVFAFTIGCSFANDEITLDVLRGLQGVGAAATIPASLGILAHAFPPSRARSIAFATFAAGAPVGGALGIILGGILTQLSAKTWRSTFYLQAGLTALCFAGGILSFDADEPSTEPDRRVDWLGAALVTIGLTLIVFVLSDGEVAPQQWRTPYIIALLIIGVVFVVLYVFWQGYLERAQNDPAASNSRWTPPPLMKLSIWARAHGRFGVMQCIAFLNWAAFMSWTFWTQLYYQEYLLLTPILTMVRLLPMFVTGLLCNFVIANVVGRVPVVYLMVIGTVLTGSASLLFAVINPHASYWPFGFPAAIIGVFGADFVFAAGTIFIAKVALPHEQSVAGALFQTMTQLGTAVGLTVSTIVFNRVVRSEAAKMGVIVGISGDGAPLPAQLHGYRAAQWTAFGFGMLAAILAAIFLRGVGVVGYNGGHDPEADSEKTVTEDRDQESERVPV